MEGHQTIRRILISMAAGAAFVFSISGTAFTGLAGETPVHVPEAAEEVTEPAAAAQDTAVAEDAAAAETEDGEEAEKAAEPEDGKAADEAAAEPETVLGAEAYEAVDVEAAIQEAQAPRDDYVYESIDLTDAVTVAVSPAESGEDQAITVIQNDRELSAEEQNQLGISFNGQQLQLGKGTFILSGELNGQVAVKAGKNSEAVLVLDNFTVVNLQDAAILCSKTESLILMLADGSDNTVISAEPVEINEESYELAADASGGAFHSKAYTTITGTGSLNVEGYINNGIHVTKSLTIDSGIISVTAVNNGIKVKDTLTVNGGNLNILSGNDGIKAETEEQAAQEALYDEETGELIQEALEAEEAAGRIEINSGTITVESYNDSVEALLDLTVNGGFLNLVANGTYISKGAYRSTFDSTFSAKGLKSGGTLQVNGGTTVVKSYNDGVHADGIITINGGVLSVYCGDDGIHSDVQTDINDGIVNISNSYEGIEANQITINGGTVTVFAWDDGMNANGGRGFGSRGGRSSSSTSTETPNLIVNGGDIYVNAKGDGMDSNGNLIVNGGKLVVDGPTDSWNGPLDGGTENGGVIQINGGVAFAGGASGMAESFNNKSEQVSFLALLAGGYQSGSQIRILTQEGEELFSHIPASAGTSIVFSCPELQQEETYILEIDEIAYEVKLTGVSTRVQVRKNSN